MTEKNHEKHYSAQARLDTSSNGGKTLVMFEKARGFKAITPETIRACQENDSRAWDTFYLHLTGDLSAMICRCISKRTPASVGWKLKRNVDIVDEIFLLIFTKIQRSINDFDPANHLQKWLWQVVDSQVVDWVRKTRQQKRGASQTEGEENTFTSFAKGGFTDDEYVDILEIITDPESFDVESNIIEALDDTLPDVSFEQVNTARNLTADFSKLIKIYGKALDLDEEETWLIRLRIIYLAPLDYPEEVDNLSAFTGRPRDFLTGELKKIEKRLDAQNERWAKAADKAGIAATQLRRQQLTLSQNQSVPEISQAEMDRLEEKIASLRTQMIRHGLQTKSPIHPRTEEIARLLGLINDHSSPKEIKRTEARLNTRMNRLKNKFRLLRQSPGCQI